MTLHKRLGVGVLDLPDLKGISLENYEQKLEQKCRNSCAKKNKLELNRLNTVLKLNDKSKHLYNSNVKVDHDMATKKLINFKMAWYEIHPKENKTEKLLQKERSNSENPMNLPKTRTNLTSTSLPKITINHQNNQTLTKQNTMQQSEEEEDDKFNVLFGQHFKTREETGQKLNELSEDIVNLTFKQRVFLAKIQGLLKPKMESKVIDDNKKNENPVRRSRLYIELPMPMDGGELGYEVRRSSYKFTEDAPQLELPLDKLLNSTKPDILATWVGMEKEDLERVQKKDKEEKLQTTVSVQSTFPAIKLPDDNVLENT